MSHRLNLSKVDNKPISNLSRLATSSHTTAVSLNHFLSLSLSLSLYIYIFLNLSLDIPVVKDKLETCCKLHLQNKEVEGGHRRGEDIGGGRGGVCEIVYIKALPRGTVLLPSVLHAYADDIDVGNQIPGALWSSAEPSSIVGALSCMRDLGGWGGGDCDISDVYGERMRG